MKRNPCHVRLRGGPYNGNLCVPFDRGTERALKKPPPWIRQEDGAWRYKRTKPREHDLDGNVVYDYREPE